MAGVQVHVDKERWKGRHCHQCLFNGWSVLIHACMLLGPQSGPQYNNIIVSNFEHAKFGKCMSLVQRHTLYVHLASCLGSKILRSFKALGPGCMLMFQLRFNHNTIIMLIRHILGVVPMSWAPGYCASKHGVVGFSRSLQGCSATDGIRVNCICPEFIDTSLVNDGLAFLNEESKAFIKETGLLRYKSLTDSCLLLPLSLCKPHLKMGQEIIL